MKSWIIILGISFSLILIGVGLFLYFEREGMASSLPAVTYELDTSPDNLDIVLERASKYEQRTAMRRVIIIRYEDWYRYTRHITNIARSKGWHIHDWNYDDFKIILPASDFTELLHWQDDPVGFVRRNIPDATVSKGPANLELIHVQIDHDLHRKKPDLLILGAVVSWFLSAIILVYLMVYIVECAVNKSKKRKEE